MSAAGCSQAHGNVNVTVMLYVCTYRVVQAPTPKQVCTYSSRYVYWYSISTLQVATYQSFFFLLFELLFELQMAIGIHSEQFSVRIG